MRTLPPVTPSELEAVRAAYGLSVADLAKYLDVPERRVRRWESGGYLIPAGIADEIRGLADTIDYIAGAIRDDWQRTGAESMTVVETQDGLPNWAYDDYSPGLWRAGAVRAHLVYGVRLTGWREACSDGWLQPSR